jgi:hypothetical protein
VALGRGGLGQTLAFIVQGGQESRGWPHRLTDATEQAALVGGHLAMPIAGRIAIGCVYWLPGQ